MEKIEVFRFNTLLPDKTAVCCMKLYNRFVDSINNQWYTDVECEGTVYRMFLRKNLETHGYIYKQLTKISAGDSFWILRYDKYKDGKSSNHFHVWTYEPTKQEIHDILHEPFTSSERNILGIASMMVRQSGSLDDVDLLWEYYRILEDKYKEIDRDRSILLIAAANISNSMESLDLNYNKLLDTY